MTSVVDENTIVAGDFNATAEEWNSPTTDARGHQLKRWINTNNLWCISSTKNLSKRSHRHIDLIFTNLINVKTETVLTGSSDHWLIIMSSDKIGIAISEKFPKVN